MKALIIVDVQNDFLPGGSLAVPRGNEVIPVINKLQSCFDLVVATQDWHPQGHKSFASSHHEQQPFNTIRWMGHEQVLWPDHCVQGTPGALISDQLDMHRVEAIFRKGTNIDIDSYSGFYDNNHSRSTALADYLRGKQVTAFYLAGLAGDFCVYYSAIDALLEGFQTCLVEDASRPISEEGYDKAKQDIIARGGGVIFSNTLYDSL